MKTRSEPRARQTRLVFAASVVGTLLRVSSAEADPAKPAAGEETASLEARSLFEEGSRLYDLGDYEQAIQRFQRSYTLSGAVPLLLNIAQAHRLRGDCVQAVSFYRRYLDKRPDAPRRAEVEARLAEMQACVDAGPRPAPGTRAVQGPTSPPAPAAPAASAAAPRAKDGSSTYAIVGWSGVAVATAGAGLAATTLVMTLSHASSLADACRSDGGCPASERDRIASYELTRTLAIVGGVITGVGVGVAIFGFAHGHDTTTAAPLRQRGATAAELWLGPTQLGLRCAF